METDFGRRVVRLFVGGWALRKSDFSGEKIVLFCCQNYGYIELYGGKRKKPKASNMVNRKRRINCRKY